MDISTENAIKEAEWKAVQNTLHALGLRWQPRNRYEQWKRDHWPSWLKRWQPVKYGWVKATPPPGGLT